ncbi:hypothetical protein LDENG_00175440, partial [Lucifuga dentata]
MQYAADIWLVRGDFVFEFPRPTMPNVVYIGGFQCTKAKPLPAELEAFMQSSGQHGVVVMSLGTFVSALPHKITEAIAAAFAQLPQKVIWRYVGEPPSTLGNNTLLVKWLPQNDLLGHPKTRAFVSHGGTNGLYEAIYHGVPVLGFPLLFDQFDNILRLKVRGAAWAVEANSITTEGFLETLKDILETPSYRQNMQRLSKLHRDRPMSPMDTTIFWIEYVIRHKGAAHLCSAGFSLPWYSYHSLDVACVCACHVHTTHTYKEIVDAFEMMSMKPIFLLALYFLLHSPTCCNGSRILVAPVDGSHWINMEIILKKLHSRGHNLTVLSSPKSWYIPSNSSMYTSINVPSLEDETDEFYYNKMLLRSSECRKLPTFIRSFCQQYLITSMLAQGHEVLARGAAKVFDDPVLMKKLQDAK